MNTVSTDNNNTVFALIEAEKILDLTSLSVAANGNTLFAAFTPEAVAEWHHNDIEVPFWNTDTRRTNVSRARGVASALMSIMAGNIAVGLGFVLYNKETPLGEEVPNLGYVIGARLHDIFPNAEVISAEAVKSNVLYRVNWASWGYQAVPVHYIRWEAGESDEPKHARATLRKFDGFTLLYAAFKRGSRVKLAWKTEPQSHNENFQPLMDHVLKMYAHYVAGETEAIEEMRAIGLGKARLWKSTGEAYRKVARGAALTAEYMRDHNSGEEIAINEDLIGRTFKLYKGSLLIDTITMREEAWEKQANGIVSSGNTVVEVK